MSTDTPLAWDDSRCAELAQLRSLLNEVSSINSGNNCLQRIARCIDLAERLSQWGYGRVSFIGFLDGLAIAERSAAKEAA